MLAQPNERAWQAPIESKQRPKIQAQSALRVLHAAPKALAGVDGVSGSYMLTLRFRSVA
jgi:hypothetical protein